MKPLVKLKSYQNGISIYLDQDAPFLDLEYALAEKFKEAASFFKNAKMAITFENRVLNDAEERVLIQIITENSQVEVLCVIGKDERTEKQFIKALKQMEMSIANAGNMAQIYKGNITNNKRVESDDTIIVFGDVNPGCCVSSEKDIIILGGLYGQANAGLEETSGHFVIALDMAPEKLTINHYNHRIVEKSKWPIKQKVQPKIAYELDGTICVDAVSKEIMQKLVEIC